MSLYRLIGLCANAGVIVYAAYTAKETSVFINQRECELKLIECMKDISASDLHCKHSEGLDENLIDFLAKKY